MTATIIRQMIRKAVLLLLLAAATPAWAQGWPTVQLCIAAMGNGDPNSIVAAPPSLFSKENPQRALDWCRDHRSESAYRLGELGKAGVGFLIIVSVFSPLKHGNMLVPLRRIYGPHLAGSEPETEKLSEVLQKLDEPSLSALVHDHEHGHLDGKIAQHA